MMSTNIFNMTSTFIIRDNHFDIDWPFFSCISADFPVICTTGIIFARMILSGQAKYKQTLDTNAQPVLNACLLP